MSEICECTNWAGSWFSRFRTSDKIPIPTNHHPNCLKYNDSLIDVWKTTVDGVSSYTINEQDALDSKGDNGIVTQEKMHKEVFENLPEFGGF